MNFTEIFSACLSVVPALISLLVIFRLRQPTTPAWWMLKVFASALSPIWLLIGLICLVLGLIFEITAVVVFGIYSSAVFLIHILKVTQKPDPDTGFEKAFGVGWKIRIPYERKMFFLKRRFSLDWPDEPDPVFKQNVVFHTYSGNRRQLLCDIWEPSDVTTRSGLVFIYLFGSAWTLLDKDFGTRSFFRHLTSQGHVVMDVAYRLFPETDMLGMVYDAKYAIAWMKDHSAEYNVDPDRIVIGGGSAGAHIAMLAAYTGKSSLAPADLASTNLTVRGVINMYGPPDLTALYYHTGQHLTSKNDDSTKVKHSGVPHWLQKKMGANYHRLGMDKKVAPGILAPILGGHPSDKQEVYALFSPISHVHSDCPPTLLVLGKHDIITPVSAAQKMASRLRELNIPVVMHLIPQADHAFDLVLPKISPSAPNAIHDVECFLALMC